MASVTRGVFKVLGMVPVVIITSSLAIEFMNLSISSQQLRHDIGIALSNACESFNQESYLSTEVDSILDELGGIYISGDVYNTNMMYSEEDKYKYFFGYTNSYDSYYNWLTRGTTLSNSNTPLSSIYKDLGSLELGLRYRKTHQGAVEYSSDMADIIKAVTRIDAMYTPMNSGVPYIGLVDENDRAYTAVNKLFRWNLAQMLSQCNSERIEVATADEPGNTYISYNGWRVYVKEAKISSIEYSIYDITKAEDRQELYSLISVGESMYANTAKNNKYIVLIKIGYEVPVGYSGITPFGSIYNYAMTDGAIHNTADVYRYVATTVSSRDNNDYVYYYNVE